MHPGIPQTPKSTDWDKPGGKSGTLSTSWLAFIPKPPRDPDVCTMPGIIFEIMNINY